MKSSEPWQTYYFATHQVFVFRAKAPNGEYEFSATTKFADNRSISVVASTIEEALFGLGHALGGMMRP